MGGKFDLVYTEIKGEGTTIDLVVNQLVDRILGSITCRLLNLR